MAHRTQDLLCLCGTCGWAYLGVGVVGCVKQTGGWVEWLELIAYMAS